MLLQKIVYSLYCVRLLIQQFFMDNFVSTRPIQKRPGWPVFVFVTI